MSNPPKGHNVVDTKQLREFCERVESLIEDRKEVNSGIKQVLEEAEHVGYDKKTIKEVIKFRAMDAEDRKEQQELTDMYLSALGLL